MSALIGVFTYELRMQVRKRSMWLLLAALFAVMLATRGPKFPTQLAPGTPMREVMGTWALAINLIAPVVIGTVLADRLVRDRRLGVEEVLAATPTSSGIRLWGKYLGAVSAGLLPIAVALVIIAGYEAARRGDIAAFGWAVLAFGAVNVPGIVFVAAFALLIPVAISAPLFRVLFVGYWFWGNLLDPDLLPGPTGSVLTPLGDYAAAGLFGADRLWASWPGIVPILRPSINATSAAASIVLLVGTAVAVLFAGQALLQRRNNRL